MSANQGGSFATLLLAVPLSAIPLMAIFGIPEFAQLSASTSEPDSPEVVRQPTDSFETLEQTDPVQRHRQQAADLLAPPQSHPSVPQAGGESHWWEDAPVAGTSAPPPATQQSRQPSPRPMQTAASQPLIRTISSSNTQDITAGAARTSNGLTWRQAARKLEELGITDYRLERRSAERFLFACECSPGSDARIVRRFEAEAGEPLAAVEDVLGQVDQWLQHRFADSRRWLP